MKQFNEIRILANSPLLQKPIVFAKSKSGTMAFVGLLDDNNLPDLENGRLYTDVRRAESIGVWEVLSDFVRKRNQQTLQA